VTAQASDHQRLSVQGRENLDLSIGASCSLRPQEGLGGSGLELAPCLSLDLLLYRSVGLSLSCLFVAWVGTERYALPRAAASLGDPSAALSYTFRAADWRLGAEVSYSHPAGIWDSYEAQAKGIYSGSGYPTIGAAFSAVRYLDPIVAGLRLEADTGLARRERFSSSTKPLDLRVNLFATEALNASAALTVGLSNGLAWPAFHEGISDEPGLRYSLSGNAALVLRSAFSSLRIGISKGLSGSDSPASLDISYSYTFKTEE